MWLTITHMMWKLLLIKATGFISIIPSKSINFLKNFGCTFHFQSIILHKKYWKYVFLQLEIARITRMELPAINYPPRAGLRVIDHPKFDKCIDLECRLITAKIFGFTLMLSNTPSLILLDFIVVKTKSSSSSNLGNITIEKSVIFGTPLSNVAYLCKISFTFWFIDGGSFEAILRLE